MASAAIGHEHDDRRWLGLILLCATQFMVVLDVSIVNVALPSIQRSLDFTVEDLQWVASAYALTFGGFLLLGGRAADFLGRRRVFMAGLVLFSLASLACGLATSDTLLIVFRAVQGVGAAIISPAALSILTTTFTEGAERNKALGVWGAIAGLGGAAGVMLGGILTDTLGWEWIFFINVPIGVAIAALAPSLLNESRVEGMDRRFDVAGAVTVTAGLIVLVYALVGTSEHGWTSGRSLGLLALSAGLLLAFVLIEVRAAAPLVPGRLLRLPTLVGANVVGLLLGCSIFTMFFFLSLYMQEVLGYSALRTGVAYLVVAFTIIISAAVSQMLVTKLGVRTVMAAGMLLVAAGIGWFTMVSVDGTYAVDLLPGFLLAGAGLGFSFVPDAIAALEGTTEHDAGVASGLINTSQQIGGAVGVAALVAVSSNITADSLRDDPGAGLQAVVDGFHAAFLVGAIVALVGVVVTLVLISPAAAPHEHPAQQSPAAADSE